MKLVLALSLALAMSLGIAAQTSTTRVMPADFKSDNCTLFPDGDYADCCEEHDKDYYFGGTNAERKASDARLKQCVASKGKGWKRRLLAKSVYLGVRLGGVQWLPTPFRWGFGNKRPHKSSVKARVEMPKDIH